MTRREDVTLLTLLAAAILVPLAITDDYLMHLLVMACFYALLASSLNLVVGYLGELSLGHTAFLGIGAYSSALATMQLGLPFWAAMLLAGLFAAIGGLVIGYLTLRLEGAYFVIVTLSFAQVLRLLANNWVGLTNGPMGVSGIVPPSFGSLVLQGKHAFYYLGLALAALGIAAVRFYVRSNLGRAAIAVRENRNVAHSVGIDPFTVGLITFVLAAFLAGIAGAFYGHYITFVGPEIFGFGFMASMLIMVLAGGQGTLVGPILGALLVTLLQEYLRAAQEIRLTLFGALLMLLVLVMPRGLAGLARSLRRAG